MERRDRGLSAADEVLQVMAPLLGWTDEDVAAERAAYAERVAEIAAAFPGEIAVMQSNPTYIEIVPAGVSKASAMLKVAADYGISAAEIMAIGDSGNDVAMLRAASTISARPP